MSADHGSSHGHDGPPPPPEPNTPMWLPALGAALFLLVGLWWATRPEPPAPIATDDTADAAAADAGAAPQQANPQGNPAGQAAGQQAAQGRPGQPGSAPPPGAGRPGGPGSADASAPLSPAQAAQLQKILKGAGH